MVMRGEVRRLSKEGLVQFHSLGPDAVSAVTERLYAIRSVRLRVE